eukprot:364447-Chlamydomonas_euryale.AAC.9
MPGLPGGCMYGGWPAAGGNGYCMPAASSGCDGTPYCVRGIEGMEGRGAGEGRRRKGKEEWMSKGCEEEGEGCSSGRGGCVWGGGGTPPHARSMWSVGMSKTLGQQWTHTSGCTRAPAVTCHPSNAAN